MRGLASLVVCFYHTRAAFFIPYRQAGRGFVVNLLYIDHFFAGAAVLFFFVLSGYLVGTSVIRAHARHTWSWGNYLLSRLTRLYMVLLPALLLCVLLDFIGHHSAIAIPTYTEVVDPANGYSLWLTDTWKSFWGTAFFVQNILTPVFGTIGPAWSLTNEFWYYILFPVAVCAFVKSWRAIVYVLVFVALVYFVSWSIMFLFLTWLAGIGAGMIADKYPLRQKLLRWGVFVASALLFLGTTLAAAAHKIMSVPTNTFVPAQVLSMWPRLDLCGPRSPRRQPRGCMPKSRSSSQRSPTPSTSFTNPLSSCFRHLFCASIAGRPRRSTSP